MTTVTRRDLLRLGAATAAGAAALPARAEAQTATRVRRDVNTPAAADAIATYRAAVRYLRQLPSGDRRSWAYQTRIHVDWCPHRNWYLLPWHREYLLALENIIRSLPEAQVPGAANFAMPYWDWTRDPRLPAAFVGATLSDGSANPLHDPTRVVGAGSTIPDELVGASAMRTIYDQTRFETFASARPPGQTNTNSRWQRRQSTQGPLEATPHNGVHNWIRGNMATMSSPRDPIFFLHHGNIDRIWASWNGQGKANTTATPWRNFTFRQNFARPTGALYDVVVRNIGMAGYRYDRLDAAPPGAPQAAAFAAAGAAPVGKGRVARTFRVPNRKRAALGRPAAIAVDLRGQGGELAPRSLLRLLRIAPPPVANAPFVRVFVDHPSLGPDAPPKGPHYVGTVSFFGTPAQHHAVHEEGGMSSSSFELPLTQVLARVPVVDALTVQIVPVALGATVEQVEIRPEEVEVEFY